MPLYERRTNSIRIGWGNWRIVWVIDPERDVYLADGWVANFLTERLIILTRRAR